MKWLSLALSLLPGILNGVVAVEAALKGQPGQTKKGVILAAVGAAAGGVGPVFVGVASVGTAGGFDGASAIARV